MGPLNYAPPASLPSRGGKAAPVTSLRDPSPTRPTPVKLEPRPLPVALPSLPIPGPCHPPPGAPRRWGTRRDPHSAGTLPPAKTRPRQTPRRPPRRILRAPFPRRPPQWLSSLTWPEAGPRSHCPGRGPPQEGAAAAAGVRQRTRRLLSGGFWVA